MGKFLPWSLNRSSRLCIWLSAINFGFPHPPEKMFSIRADQRQRAGLVRQRVQIVAARDLSLVDRSQVDRSQIDVAPKCNHNGDLEYGELYADNADPEEHP